MSDILTMMRLVVRSLFKKPACDRYPFKPFVPHERTRGHVAIDEKRCILCTLCEKRCPTGAIRVSREGHTWQIDHLRCILCRNCVEVCPPKCLSMEKLYAPSVTKKEIPIVNVPAQPKKA